MAIIGAQIMNTLSLIPSGPSGPWGTENFFKKLFPKKKDFSFQELSRSYRIQMELVGFIKDEISVTFNSTESLLWIFASSERRFRSVKKSFFIPGPIDSSQIKISYEDNTLEVLIPKSAAQQSFVLSFLRKMRLPGASK